MAGDEERREVERLARAGDKEAIARIQALNDRLGLSRHDAEYLEAYVDICNRFAGDDTSNKGATPESFDPKTSRLTAKHAVSQLLALNKRYELLVGGKTLKFTLPAIHIGPEGTRGWQEGGAPPVSDLPEDLGEPYDYHTRYLGRWNEDWWIPSDVNC